MAYLAGLSRELIRAAAAAPFLERDEEKQLATAWREYGDPRALDKLTAAHMRLVIAIAAKFRSCGLPIADLVQEGHIGLMEAAKRFEPELNHRFSTYAIWWIRAATQNYILENWSIVRGGTSSQQKRLFFSLRRLRAKLGINHEESAFQKIADIIGVSVAEVELMNTRLSSGDMSLNTRLTDDEGAAERIDFLFDDSPLPDEIVEERIDFDRHKRLLKEACQVLNPRERRIFEARRLADPSLTLEYLSEEFGLSRERVRQIEVHAFERVRRVVRGERIVSRAM